MTPSLIPEQPDADRPSRRGRRSQPISDKAGPVHRVWLEQIRRRMTARGMTLGDLEHRSGYSKTALSELLRGNYYPSWLLTYSVIRTLDMPAQPMLRLWRAAAREASKETGWIDRSIETVATMQPELPPLALQALAASMRDPYTDYARVFLQLDERARWIVAHTFDILWVRWDEAAASPSLNHYAWDVLRTEVIARAPQHTDGSPDLRAASLSTRAAQHDTADLSEQLAGIARLTDVFDSIGRLPADHRDAVLLHHSCGYDENEVASITGMSEAVVHSHLRHAHRILHDLHIDDIPGAAQ